MRILSNTTLAKRTPVNAVYDENVEVMTINDVLCVDVVWKSLDDRLFARRLQ